MTRSRASKRNLVVLAFSVLGMFGQAGIESRDADSAAARSALEGGDYKRAEEIYRALVQANPESAELRSNLGVALHLQGKSAAAIESFERALRLKEMPGTLALLGAEYCKMRERMKAARILQRAKRYLSDTAVLATLAPCFLEVGEALDAISVYRELARRDVSPQDENTVNLARALLQASNHFASLLRKSSGSEVYVRALHSARENASPNARSAVPSALKAAPYLRPDMGVEELSQFLAKHRSAPALLYVLAVASGEESMQTFLIAEQRFPKSAAVRQMKGEILASQGSDELAIAEYDSLARDYPALPDIPYKLAMLHRKRADLENALLQFRRQTELAPNDERANFGISESLLRLGRFEEARNFLQPLTSLATTPVWALLDLAAAEQSLQRYDQAIATLERAVKRNPRDRTIHYRLSRLYQLAGRQDLAEREMRLFRSLTEENADKVP